MATKPTPNPLVESLQDVGIFRTVKDADGYEVQQLEASYDGTKVHWGYQNNFKTLRKARKELYRLSKGQVY